MRLELKQDIKSALQSVMYTAQWRFNEAVESLSPSAGSELNEKRLSNSFVWVESEDGYDYWQLISKLFELNEHGRLEERTRIGEHLAEVKDWVEQKLNHGVKAGRWRADVPNLQGLTVWKHTKENFRYWCAVDVLFALTFAPEPEPEQSSDEVTLTLTIDRSVAERFRQELNRILVPTTEPLPQDSTLSAHALKGCEKEVHND